MNVDHADPYMDADKEIRDAVINISNKYEIGKKDTIAILTYLIHNIVHIKETS